MGEYRYNGRAVWDVKYHLIWITKYRYKILGGGVAEQAREVSIIRGAISPDHVHMLVGEPPQLAPAKLVYMKGRLSRCLQEKFAHLRKRYWGQHLWARGDFCTTGDRRLGITYSTKTGIPDRLSGPPRE